MKLKAKRCRLLVGIIYCPHTRVGYLFNTYSNKGVPKAAAHVKCLMTGNIKPLH